MTALSGRTAHLHHRVSVEPAIHCRHSFHHGVDVNPLFVVPKPVEIARSINGEPMLSATGVQLMLGVLAADFENMTDGQPLPREWIKSGRRRAGEYRAHTGRNDALGSLAYWAEQDHNADLVEDDDGTVWMVKRGDPR